MSNKNQHSKIACAILLLSLGCFRGQSQRPGDSSQTAPQGSPSVEPVKEVKASYYGENDGFAGKKTASGEIFKPEELTAAHKTLPFGTKVEVKNPENGKKVEVRINDRGPGVKGRALDLSAGAAKQIDLDEKGTAKVEMKVLPSSK